MDVMLSPIISEKSMLSAGKGRFTFAVAKDANKQAIKKAIEQAFKVNVTQVATTIVKGRTKRGGARREEKVLSSWKKAMVTLKSGQKIDIFDTV